MASRRVKHNGIVAAVGSLSVLALLLAARPVGAQQGDEPAFILVEPSSPGEPFDIGAAERINRSRFRLFAEGDRAWTSTRMVGDNCINQSNTGIGERDNSVFGSSGTGCSAPIDQRSTANGDAFQSFGIPLLMGAPRGEWVQYLVEGVTSLQNALGEPPGWTVMWNGDIFGRTKDWNAADGLVGNLLSGVVSTTDGTCTDHQAFLGGASMSGGFQLLPGSNCEVTWSNGGTEFTGDRPISIDSWVAHRDSIEALGETFEWNRWQVPAFRKDATKFMGNNFATYGHFNDYNSSTLTKFGNVVPGGSGDPSRQGWPMGIDFYFDAFTFTIPTVANAKFWAALVVNNSEALYGVAHDYDSLYVGIGMWPGRSQDGDNYMIPELGAWVSAESSDPNGPECAVIPAVPLFGATCGGFSGRPNSFEQGGHGIVFLKTPIGDLRNKLFSDPASPFFDVTHPLVGDTITYNHAINWNFGPWGAVWNQGTDRRRFGVLSSTPENILDGTACPDFISNDRRWRTFRSNTWPDAATMCDMGGWVPGDWQYTSHRPLGAGVGPDTLWLSGCGPFDGGGCPVAWADTVWQGWNSNSFGNLSEPHVGPFRLEAGDTAEFLLATFSGKDSVSLESFTQGVYDFYLGLFAGPEAPPRVTIRGVELGAGVTPGDTAAVTLVWDDAAETFTDPFLAKFADDIEGAPLGTELAQIRDANPGLVARIRARASDNLERLLLFRSCDGGATFDADGDCQSDPAVDGLGNSVGTGFQAFARFDADASGDAANVFTDALVTPGVTYLYAIIGESRGFEEVVINDPGYRIDPVTLDVTCGPANCELTNLVVAPSLLNPLSRSAADPNVISVYVPASVPAGGAAATVEFVDRDSQGRSTTPFELILSSSDIRENRFRAVFSNFVTVEEDRDAATGELLETRVTIRDRARTVVAGGTVTQDTDFSSTVATRTDAVPVTLNDATLVSEVTAGGVTTRTFDIGPGPLDPDDRFAIAMVLLEETASGSVPLLATGDLGGASATPGGFLANPGFPGFLVSADNSGATSFDRDFYTDVNGDTLSQDLEPTLDFDQVLTANSDVQFQTHGEYVITFTDSVFGPQSPFRLSESAFNNPETVDAVFDQSLAGRTRGTTGATDAETVDLVAAELGLPPAEVTLVAANIPFTMTNTTHGRTATLAMEDRGETRKILGLGRDTLSVTVAADQWIPTDVLYVIENVTLFTTQDVGGDEAIVLNPDGSVQTETRRIVTLSSLNLDCATNNPSCNPVVGAGSGSWIGVQPGDNHHVLYFSPFTNQSEYVFDPKNAITGEDIISSGGSIAARLDSVQVVPNPYLFFSAYETSAADRRVMFTNLPPDGEIRIYTIAGNFVQELDWGPGDLAGNGDLYWDLQTREGNELGGGLFLFVVRALDPATGERLTKLGKFVVIR